jgi:hypothetical protein
MTAIGSGSRAGRQAVRLGYAANDPALIEPAEHEAFAADAFPRAAREHPQGCSFAQEQFWFVDQLAPGNLAHSFSWPVRLRGRLDATALERAFVEVVRRHEALRTMFSLEDGQPVQVVGAHDAFRLERVDISSERDPESVAQRLVDEDTRRPFDLGRQPAFRARLIRLSENEHVLQTVVHHIVFDEWSKVLLYRELSALYAAFAEGRPSPLAEPRAQLADFAAWQRSRLTEQVLQEELDHWQQELEGAPAVLDLPSDRRDDARKSTAISAAARADGGSGRPCASRRSDVVRRDACGLRAVALQAHWRNGLSGRRPYRRPCPPGARPDDRRFAEHRRPAQQRLGQSELSDAARPRA